MSIKIFDNFFSNLRDKRLINLSNKSFWSVFFVATIAVLFILIVFSIYGANFLEKITNPIKFIDNNKAIVEIYPEEVKERTEAKVLIVKDFLSANKNIEAVNLIPREEVVSLVKNWNNDLNNIGDFELPILISIEFSKDNNISVSDLQILLNEKAENVFVFKQEEIVNKLVLPLNLSREIILSIPVLIMIIMSLIITFVTMALVYAHKNTIEILSFLGASYLKIAVEFSSWIFKKALIGNILGLGISLILLELILLITRYNYFLDFSNFSIIFITVMFILIPVIALFVTILVIREIIKWII